MEAKQHAVGKLQSRMEKGEFAVLFSVRMQETMERAAEDARLGTELGFLRVTMLRALREIEDPGEMAAAISRVAGASARTHFPAPNDHSFESNSKIIRCHPCCHPGPRRYD